MRQQQRGRLLRVVVSAVVVSAGALVAISAPAQANTSTVTVPFRCGITAFGVTYDDLQPLPVTITAPDAVPAGDPIPVTVKLGSSPSIPPVALTNVVARLAPTVTAQNHAGGPITSATGLGAPSAPTNIAANGQLPVDAPVVVTVPPAGFGGGDQIDLKPAAFTATILSGDGGIGGASMTCTPEPGPAPTATFVSITGLPSPPSVGSCTADTGNVNTGSCTTGQDPSATVLSGVLAQAATAHSANPDATTILMGTVTSSGTAQPLNGVLNPVTVTDTRGGSFQWSLTATMTDYETSAGYDIAASRTTITPACAASTPGSAPGAVAGSAQPLGSSPITLCTGPSLPSYTTGTTGGQWTISGPLDLSVPAFAGAGAYVAVLTINLA